MNAARTSTVLHSDRCPDDALKDSLTLLGELVDGDLDTAVDAVLYNEVGDELRRLHARFRSHDASNLLGGGSLSSIDVPPEYSGEVRRLQGEHSHVLGMLDWLTRRVDAIADSTLEDKDVFLLRTRELIAVLRRHVAEEDRLFYLSVWRDTGGEG